MSEGPRFSLLVGGRTLCDPDWWHSQGGYQAEDFKLYIPITGKGFYDIGGGEEPIAPGSFILIPGLRQSRYRCTRQLLVDWIHVRLHDPRLVHLVRDLKRIKRWPIATWRAWAPVYTRFAEYFPARPEALGLRIHGLLACVMAELVAAAPVSTPTTSPPWLDGVVAFLDAHHQRDPSLAEIARRAGLSAIHCHRAFTAATGLTPRSWMERRRMDRARALLAEASLPVTEIAKRCGYEDPFHFSRAFRRLHGRSPVAWRRDSP